MTREAALVRTDHGLVPDGDGWFVVNARAARWWRNEAFGALCEFEGDARFGELGINVHVLDPGQSACLYHGEGAQEDFLVLFGECLLVIEGEERRLRAWDFVHCPPATGHVFVGAGSGPCGILMAGARRPEVPLRYPPEPAAARHGAAVERETTAAAEAYAPFPAWVEASYREGDLPDPLA
ncbi:MAG: cupin domain-containing protein [Thermoleophilia bacterium]|nr:cupin domain-containing protein [Thermoleophilia bacterium]